MLKLNIARETTETNPFVDIWASDRPAKVVEEPQQPRRSGAHRFTLFMTLSSIACFLGMCIAGYGLYEISQPHMPLGVGIGFAGLGATMVVGCSLLIQALTNRLKALLRQRERIAAATGAQ